MTDDRGLDYSLGRPDLDQAWAAGYRFALRYLSWLPNPKCVDAAELAALLGRGFEVALNWEFDAQDALRGTFGGRDDATEAVSQAQALEYPAGCTIYFSADFDETETQAPVVEAYMRAAGALVHAVGYRMGGYGGYYTIRRLLDAGAVDDGWQTYAWSGGQWDPRAALRQVLNGVTVGGADCDIDQRVGQTHFMGQQGDDDMASVIQTSDNHGNTVLLNPAAHTFTRIPARPASLPPDQTYWPLQNKLEALARTGVAIVSDTSIGWPGGYDLDDPATWIWAGVEVKPEGDVTLSADDLAAVKAAARQGAAVGIEGATIHTP